MTSYRVDVDDWGRQKTKAVRLPPPGPETNSWYVEIPGMAEWLERMKDAYRWCAHCLVIRKPAEHDAHLVIHRKDHSG